MKDFSKNALQFFNFLHWKRRLDHNLLSKPNYFEKIDLRVGIDSALKNENVPALDEVGAPEASSSFDLCAKVQTETSL